MLMLLEKILNKMIRWTNGGIELEADPRHAEIVVRELGLEAATPSKVPGAKADSDSASEKMITPCGLASAGSVAGRSTKGAKSRSERSRRRLSVVAS